MLYSSFAQKQALAAMLSENTCHRKWFLTRCLTRANSGNEIGPFRAIEESIVAQLTVPDNRSDVYAWYSLFGLAGAAFGFMICGWVLQIFTEVLHWDLLYSYRIIYAIYAAIGVIKLCLTFSMSHSIEGEIKKQRQENQYSNQGDETAPLLDSQHQHDEAAPADAQGKRSLRAFLPNIRKDSAAVVIILCLLFGLDAFGSGVNPL